MKSARRLLVPIDFSHASKTAVKYALNEKQHENDILVLMHSYRLISEEFSNYRDSPMDLKKTLESQLMDNYRDFNKDLIYASDRPEIEFRMEVGFIVNCIYTICQESEVDLILYALKQDKQNQALSDLVALNCAPVMLIPEAADIDQGLPLEIREISKQAFIENRDQFIHELESNSKISYTVMPY